MVHDRILSIPYPIYSVHGRVAQRKWVWLLYWGSLVLWPTVMTFCCCLLPEMVYKTYCNFVKSMLRSIIFHFQQIQIHPNPNPNVSILLVDVPKNRWRSSLIIRSCPGSVRLTILVISFMNQVHKKQTAQRCLHWIIY